MRGGGRKGSKSAWIQAFVEKFVPDARSPTLLYPAQGYETDLCTECHKGVGQAASAEGTLTYLVEILMIVVLESSITAKAKFLSVNYDNERHVTIIKAQEQADRRSRTGACGLALIPNSMSQLRPQFHVAAFHRRRLPVVPRERQQRQCYISLPFGEVQVPQGGKGTAVGH